jgi:hypothetical protein
MNRLIKVATMVALGAAVAACGSAKAGSSTGASPSAGFRGANMADGTLVQVSDSTLVLSTTNGDVTVDFSSSTPISETSTGSYADIAVGSCISATGSKGTTGAITAAGVTISSPVNGSCTAGAFGGGSPGAFPSGRPNFTFRPRPTPSGGGFAADFASVRGMVTAVNVTAVTVQETSGTSQTITVPTTVKVSTTTTGSTSDLVQGACVAAIGAKDSSGAVTARSLMIEPAGPSGCFTGGSGFGGFGGFGGGRPTTTS